MQGYAWEITTPEGGWGLDKVLQSRQHILNGITNGIDLDEWDPEADEHTVAAYSAGDLSGKAACKEALQKELGLEVNPDVSHTVQRLLQAATCASFLIQTSHTGIWMSADFAPELSIWMLCLDYGIPMLMRPCCE